MSWLDDIVSGAGSLIKSVGGFLGGNSIGSSVAKVALMGYALNKVTSMARKENDAARAAIQTTMVDPGTQIQVQPDTEHRLPVLYGTATFGGVITDAWLTDNNQTMYFVVSLAEQTGNLLSTSSASSYVFNDIYYNDQRLVFQTGGTVADYSIDRDGNRDESVRDLVEVYCFAGNSTSPVVPEYYTNPSLNNAYDIMPNWGSTYTMSNTLFAIVKVTYSRDKGVTGLPTMMFTITNSMKLPGDCLYDYMTNSRYGAGIDSANIGAS